MAACSLTNDAPQTVANPKNDGTTLVPVDIPMNLCAAVDTASVVPKATHPPTTGKTRSGIPEQSLAKEVFDEFLSLSIILLSEDWIVCHGLSLRCHAANTNFILIFSKIQKLVLKINYDFFVTVYRYPYS